MDKDSDPKQAFLLEAPPQSRQPRAWRKSHGLTPAGGRPVGRYEISAQLAYRKATCRARGIGAPSGVSTGGKRCILSTAGRQKSKSGLSESRKEGFCNAEVLVGFEFYGDGGVRLLGGSGTGPDGRLRCPGLLRSLAPDEVCWSPVATKRESAIRIRDAVATMGTRTLQGSRMRAGGQLSGGAWRRCLFPGQGPRTVPMCSVWFPTDNAGRRLHGDR